MTDLKTVSYTYENDIAVIKLNQPDVMNALTPQVNAELTSSIIKAGKEARVIVITGAGRAFCSGANLAGSGVSNGPDRDLGQMLTDHYTPLVKALIDSPVPIIASVNGPAVGFGCSLALACDLIIAGKSAYFQQAFCKIGLIPDGASAFFLAHSVGRARASEMMLLGEQYDAETSKQIGMINQVVEDDALESTVMGIAQKLTNGAPIALSLTRKLAWKAINTTIDEQLALEAEFQTKAGRTNDFLEGVMAFMQKRLPKFRGN
ncbi:enoyl-CoA hydratase-related protein [Hirschia litorea]|uniref:Enoyl-CoA hydratase-related protein n=1 Tax=Hirschia litorea TaxID=1199156 RepID=A0ABW2IHY6_9PROT